MNAADLEALTGPDDDRCNRVLRSTRDLEALERALEHWRARRNASEKRFHAILYRMDQIRGS